MTTRNYVILPSFPFKSHSQRHWHLLGDKLILCGLHMQEKDDRGWDGWMHHWLNGHEFEQILGDTEGQGSLVCCSPWGHKELDTTEQLTNNNRCCRQFWGAKCSKPCFLVFSQKYWDEIPISYTVTSSGANLRAHSLTGSPQTSPCATHNLSLDHPPLAGAQDTHQHPVPTLGATITIGSISGGWHPEMDWTGFWVSFTWETLHPFFPGVGEYRLNRLRKWTLFSFFFFFSGLWILFLSMVWVGRTNKSHKELCLCSPWGAIGGATGSIHQRSQDAFHFRGPIRLH